MRSENKAALLTAVSVALALAAVVCLGLAAYLIRLGAYPPEGAGSLGHVGIVIAGGIAGFTALVCALLALYVRGRARAAEPDPERS